MQNELDFKESFIRGDSSVLKKIYSKTFPYVKKWICQSDGDPSDAEDIFQSALTFLFVKIKNDELKIKDFDRYLFTVCKNMWRKEIVQRQRVTKTNEFTHVDEEEEKIRFYIEQSQWELYQEKFELLSDNCREILAMTFKKTSYDEIVKKQSYSSETVARQRVFKCKKKLTELIKKDTRYLSLKK